MAVLGAPVFPHGNLAFFVAIFSEMTRLSAGVGLRLHSIHPSITRESKWRYIMKKINLRELYPDVYTTDFFVDVTEEVMETIRAAKRAEAAYDRRMYRYKAYYSLDCDNGIENAILMKPQTPEMLLEEKQLREQLYAAVMALPEKQAKRIYARYYLGMRVSEIATAEGVDQSRVRDSIRRGLKQLAKYFRIELQMGRKVSKCFWHRALRPICTLVFFEQRKYNKPYWRETIWII